MVTLPSSSVEVVGRVNEDGSEDVLTGDDTPTDIRRARLVVSSGPDTSGSASGAQPGKLTVTPSWSAKDPASSGYDEKLADGTYPSWYLMPQKLGADYLTGDAQATRFTNYSAGSNDAHGQAGHSACWGSSLDETSGNLAIGYKSQGSFLVDFRQVDTTPNENLGNITYKPANRTSTNGSPYDNNARGGISAVAPEGTFFMEQGNSNFYNTRCPGCYSNWAYYDKNTRWIYGSGFVDGSLRDKAGSIVDQVHNHSTYYHNYDYCYNWANGSPRYNSVGSYTYNTGAHLEMVQEITGDGFDAYYIKIKQQALSYLDKVTVEYSDGKKLVVEGDDIKQLLEGTTARYIMRRCFRHICRQ